MVVNNKLLFLFALLVSSATAQADTTTNDDAPPPKPKPKPSPGSGKGNSNDGDDAVQLPNYCEVNSFSNFQQCGTNGLQQFSFCYQDVEGGYQCYLNYWCTLPTRPCTMNSDCDSGWACVDLCSGLGCSPLCTNQDGPFSPEQEDAPYYDDHANDICYPPDYVASGVVPLDEKILSGDAESAYSHGIKERNAKASFTHSNSVTDELSSLLTPLHAALMVAAIILAVALTAMLRVSSSATSSRQFTELSSSSEHSTHTKHVEVELERVSPPFDSSMKL